MSMLLDNTFFALIELVKSDGNEVIQIDARPSDAIALAVRTKASIFVSESVMMKAKMVNSEKDEQEAEKLINKIKGR